MEAKLEDLPIAFSFDQDLHKNWNGLVNDVVEIEDAFHKNLKITGFLKIIQINFYNC